MDKRKRIWVIPILLLLVSCTNFNNKEILDDVLDKKALLERAPNEYKSIYKNVENYDSLYSNPAWEETEQIINSNTKSISYYTPIKNKSTTKKSYVISTITNNKELTYFLLNIPNKHNNIDEYLEQRTDVLLIKNNDNDFAIVSNSFIMRTQMSRKGGDKFELNFETMPQDGGSLPEVVVEATGGGGGNYVPTRPPITPPTIPTTPPGGNNHSGTNNSNTGGGSSSSSGGGSNSQKPNDFEYHIPGLENVTTVDDNGTTILHPPSNNKNLLPIIYSQNNNATFAKYGLKGFPYSQEGNYCVPSACAYIKVNFYGGGDYNRVLSEYLDKLNVVNIDDPVSFDGLSKENTWAFIDQIFEHNGRVYGNVGGDEIKSEAEIENGNATALKEYQSEIDNGNSILLFYRPDINQDYAHTIVIVGYIGNDLIYVDPNYKDILLQVHKDYFKFIYYTYTIKGLKK